MPGLAAAAVALAAGEVLGALLATPSLVLSVGQEVILRVPPAVEDTAIEMFGTNDKTALVVGILAVSLALGAALGSVAVRRRAVARAGFWVFGVVGIAAAISQQPQAAIGAAVAGAGGVVGGLFVLERLLCRSVGPAPAAPSSSGSPSVGTAVAGTAGAPTAGADPVDADPQGDVASRPPPEGARLGRRRFVRVAATGAGVAVVAGAAGRGLARWLNSGTSPAEVALAPVATPLPPPFAATTLDVEGLSPLFTPNADFYRIDTALTVPRVDLETWRLRVTGMVDRPLELTFEELLGLPQIESDITLSCVSNEVGGDLVGNARWRGVVLADLLERAGVQDGADQIVGRSIDGWTGGFPTAAAVDGRGALVAVGMNGEPLPRDHGFPARLVVAGLYGYVSATKWLTEIELTTLEAFDGYWVPRGWSKFAPVKTQSRIDVPSFGGRLQAGRQPVAGVAWAPDRGISAVEVSIDEGPWGEAVLSEPLGVAAWRQWRYEWDARPGRHEIRVRATDGDGQVQIAERSLPRPDGATGYHTLTVTVTDPA